MAQAKDCFDQSMTTAKKQKSRSWQLRTATSLFRLYYGGDNQEKGVALLKEAFAMFSEGLSTPDLHDAKVLLIIEVDQSFPSTSVAQTSRHLK